MEKNGMENAKTEEKKSWFQKTKDTFREHWKGIAVGVAAVGVLVGYIVLNTESEPELSIPENLPKSFRRYRKITVRQRP